MGPTGGSNVVQVHPTRRCNLSCLHCYSSSGPTRRETIDVGVLVDGLADAVAEGYDVVSISGGEPLLYGSLPTLLGEAKALGLRTAITTNGMLLDARRLARLEGVTDLVAISLDGEPASHNVMRAHPKAFETMAARLPGLRAAGLPFGFIFTLTQHNVHELEWVAQFAYDAGAALLQVHPLETTGRAQGQLDDAHPDRLENTYAFLEAARLRAQFGDRMAIQVDVSHGPSLQADPARVYADGGATEGPHAEGNSEHPVEEQPLAQLASPLVIEPDGVVVPLVYGFDRHFALGNLHQGRLADFADTWRRTRAHAFRTLCRRVLAHATAPEAGEQPFFNWYETMRGAAVQGPTEGMPALA